MAETIGNVSDYVIHALMRQGVRRVYGYLGAAVVPLLQSVEKAGLDFVVCRTEANAALSASAEAKLTGNLAVCIATSGPGASNLVTGLLDAQADRAPVLALTGDLPTIKRGRGLEFQEMDQGAVLGPVVGLTSTAAHPQSVPALLQRAIGRALNNREAVHLCIPSDIQLVPMPDDHGLAHYPLRPIRDTTPGRFTRELFEAAAQLIVDASVSGGVAIAVGPRARGCGEAIEQLAGLIPAPVMCSLDAKGIVSEAHPDVVGVLGIFGSPAFWVSQDSLEGIGLIVAVGLDNPAVFLANLGGEQVRELVLVDHDFSDIAHSFAPKATLIGPIEEAIAGIAGAIVGSASPRASRAKGQATVIAEINAKKKAFFQKYLDEASVPSERYVHPVRLLGCLEQALARRAGSVIVPDVGDNTVWMGLFLRLSHRERLLTTAKHGVMGWSMPACLASKLAQPASTVVGIAGDGGCLMSVQELATAVQYGASFVYIVFRNAVLRRVVGSPFMAISQCNFAMMAESFGAKGLSIARNDEAAIAGVLREAFEHVDANRGPVVIDVSIDPAIGAPMAAWNIQAPAMSFK
eukprot:m51a1_g372 putative acetolactate synthase (576) ;mRNA; f:634784-636906